MRLHLTCLLAAVACNVLTVSAPASMRAVLATGSAEVGDFSKIKVVSDHPVPRPGHGQVLIKVVASSVNPIDWKLISSPLFNLITLYGLRPKILGFDVAGTIEEIGPGCRRLKPGDAIWADLGERNIGGPQLGAWADYAIADESQVGLKPQSLDFQSAASLPLAGVTTYQALKMTGAPWTNRQNVTVVITSGSGGTGTPAIQMAKAYGASRIITAASASHADLLKSLGATNVIDYHTSTIWDTLMHDSVDIVYDNYGAPGTADTAMPFLKADGIFIYLPGHQGDLSKHPKPGVRQLNFGLTDASNFEDLDKLAALADAGNLTGVVQQHLPLESIVKALKSNMAGVSKVGIDISQSPVMAKTVVLIQ